MSNLLEQASLVMIPSGYAEDIVYSEIPLDGSGDMAFTRASNGTRVNSAGLVEVCPWNLLLDSENFSSWSLEGGTLTSGQTDPNGGTTAYKYVQIPGNGLYSGNLGVTADVKFAQIWIKSVSGGAITCNISDGAAFFGTFNVTGTWQLFTAPYTANTRIGLYLYAISNASGIYVWHPQLNIGSTAKPYFPTTDRLNVPRLTYQNGGGGCPSLLLEKQSTNLMLWSEDLAQTSWLVAQLSVTANATTSPDGTQNADKIAINNGLVGGYIYQSQSTTSSTIYTGSFFVKSAGIGFTKFWSSVSGSYCNAIINLSTGVITNGASPFPTIPTATNFGNGWWRVSYTETSGGGSVPIYVDGGSTSNGGDITGNGTDGIYLWGAQLEASSYFTSYIPTTSASATRVADVCTKTGIGALIGGTSGTVFFDIKTNPTLSSANYKQFCYYFTSGGAQSYMYLNSANQLSTNSNWGSFVFSATPFVANTRYKVALVYAPNDFALYVNGVSVATASSGTPNNNVDIQIGQLNGSEMCEFVFNQYTHFPSRLTNAELASLTTI
jgi:hypothetical protein